MPLELDEVGARRGDVTKDVHDLALDVINLDLVVSPSLRTTRAPRIVAGKRRAQLSGSRYSARTRSAGAFTCSLTTASIMFDLTIWRTGPRRKAHKRIAGASHIRPFDRNFVGAAIIFLTAGR
jgi:hypothetical protein